MSRLIIPLFIILGALLYSLFWNQFRSPHCSFQAANTESVVIPPVIDEEEQPKSEELTDPEPEPEPVREPEKPVEGPAAEKQSQPEESIPEEKIVIEEKALFESMELYFNSGRSQFNRTPEVEAWLENAKKYLEQNPNVKLSVVGHTDNTGSEAGNQKLSLRRANSVKSELEKDGFKADNMEVSGMGSKEPIADNKTRDGRSKNRRVSVKLIK